MSANSRATGNSKQGAAPATGPIEITLEHARGRHLSWVVFGTALGLVILFRLGAVGQIVGFFLLAVAAYHAYRALVTMLVPAGTIAISESEVRLPDGLCRRGMTALPRTEVRHAFLLRRTVPWTQTGPLLVVETEGRAWIYPRDWFTTELDQRRVVQALASAPEPDAAA